MDTHSFLTVTGELHDAAIAAVTYFETHGHDVKAEIRDVTFPLTPTMIATRGQTVRIVEVTSSIDMTTINKWTAYCKSCSKDTRFAICVTSMEGIDGHLLEQIRTDGVGIYVIGTEGFSVFFEPKDLAMNAELPSLKEFKSGVRKSLGPAWEDFKTKGWDEGFENACKAFEKDARRYLAKWIGKRVNIVDKKGIIDNPTSKQINAMTMGALAKKYALLNLPNACDSTVRQVLELINKDRVKIAHKKKGWESVRTHVGKYMYAILNAVVAIHDNM